MDPKNYYDFDSMLNNYSKFVANISNNVHCGELDPVTQYST